jgi:hypothetical protein
MDWANERFNQIIIDVQCADENSLIAAGSTEYQHPAQNLLVLHGLLPQSRAGSEPGAVPAESSACRFSTTILDDAHQSNELLQARSHFGNLPNKPQSASTAVCTEPQYRPNPQTPPTFIDLQNDTFQNQQSLVPLDHQSNVFSLGQPQFRLNDTFHNHLQSSVFSGLRDSPHIFDDQQSLAPLDSRSDVSPAQSQPGLGNLPYIFDDQQSLQSSVFSLAQSQSCLGDSPHIFDDQQSLAPFASQLQSGVLPAQLQSGYFENLSQQQISAAFINSGGNILSNPAHFPNEQSSSIVIPLTPASAENHSTSTALVIQDLRKPSRQTSCIGCRVQKIKV